MARQYEPIYKALEGCWSEYTIEKAIEYLSEGSKGALSLSKVKDFLMKHHPRLDQLPQYPPVSASATQERETLAARQLQAKVERIVAEKIAKEATWRVTHAAKIARAKAWGARIERSVEEGRIRFD